MLGLQFRCARRFPASGLEQGDSEENANDPPLVIVDETHHRTNLVFKCLAAVPKNGESCHDADSDQGDELAWRHAEVTNQETHDV